MLLCKAAVHWFDIKHYFPFFFWLCNDVWEGWVCACVGGSLFNGVNIEKHGLEVVGGWMGWMEMAKGNENEVGFGGWEEKEGKGNAIIHW